MAAKGVPVWRCFGVRGFQMWIFLICPVLGGGCAEMDGGMVPHWARLLKKGKFVTNKDLLEEFKDLERTDILACLAYATASMKLKDIEVPAA